MGERHIGKIALVKCVVTPTEVHLRVILAKVHPEGIGRQVALSDKGLKDRTSLENRDVRESQPEKTIWNKFRSGEAAREMSGSAECLALCLWKDRSAAQNGAKYTKLTVYPAIVTSSVYRVPLAAVLSSYLR